MPRFKRTGKRNHPVENPKTRSDFVANLVLRDDQKTNRIRGTYYFAFWWTHLIAAFCLLASAISIISAAAAGFLKTDIYWTVAALRKNTAAPPEFFTDFEKINSAGLYWFFWIPLISGLFHFGLVMPAPLSRFLVQWWMTTKEYATHMRRLDEQNRYGEQNIDTNTFYFIWFEKNLLYGGSGLKHCFYGTSAAFFTVMVATLVGVTDFFLLSAVWLFTLFGFLNLWYMEYSHGHMARSAHHMAMKEVTELTGDEVPSGDITGDEGESTVFFDDKPQKREYTIEELVEAFQDRLMRLNTSWTPIVFTMISIFLPFILIIVYFSIMLAEDSGEVAWYVWTAVIYYIFYLIISITLVVCYHMDVAILADYLFLEMILSIIHVFAFVFIPLAVIFTPHADSHLYGIEVS